MVRLTIFASSTSPTGRIGSREEADCIIETWLYLPTPHPNNFKTWVEWRERMVP